MLRLLFEAQTVQNLSLKDSVSGSELGGTAVEMSGTSDAPSREKGEACKASRGGGGGGGGGVGAARFARRASRGSVDMMYACLVCFSQKVVEHYGLRLHIASHSAAHEHQMMNLKLDCSTTKHQLAFVVSKVQDRERKTQESEILRIEVHRHY
jgi:hypothetical protein